jgi:glycosyltransferase involved in cell wall biosynthesis
MKSEVNFLVFDTHPIQYRAPLWSEINKIYNEKLEVVYASDFSVRGGIDSGFGQSISWDTPLLEGYSYTILNSETCVDFSRWGSFSGKGVYGIIKSRKPRVIFLNGLVNRRFFLEVFFWASLFRIPVWIRNETNDLAVSRSLSKSWIRFLIYRFLYLGIEKAFYIGELNKRHCLKFGIKEKNLVPCRYFVANFYENINDTEKTIIRNKFRSELGIEDEKIVVIFSGKFIKKKNPELILDSIKLFPEKIRKNLVLFYIGSGELEPVLRKKASELEETCKVKTFFMGFVNQSLLYKYYLAGDILVLPSRQAGETWGLVVNEALHAGCGVVVSEYVGCSEEFKNLERFRVISDASLGDFVAAISYLVKFKRSFNWAEKYMINYSLSSAAVSIVKELKKLESLKS